jgi:hypothetical protein
MEYLLIWLMIFKFAIIVYTVYIYTVPAGQSIGAVDPVGQ